MSLWRALRTANSGWAPRLAASVISGLLLAGAGLIGAWHYSVFIRLRTYTRDQNIAMALCISGFIWLYALGWIWRRKDLNRVAIHAMILTLVLVALTVALCLMIDDAFPGTDVIIVGIGLIAGSIAAWIWTPVLIKAAHRRHVRAADGRVDVRCPTCGYALNGLRDLRCPECGTTFTIDSLIEAQRYDGSGRRDGELRKVG